jgi:hypothetical protein
MEFAREGARTQVRKQVDVGCSFASKHPCLSVCFGVIKQVLCIMS